MNIAVALDDVAHDALPSASEAGPAPKRIVVAYGFWIFLLSDIVMFSALFAAYAVLVHATAGGPAGAGLFNQVNVAIETVCLLVSSYTCGMMSLSVNARSHQDRCRSVPASIRCSKSPSLTMPISLPLWSSTGTALIFLSRNSFATSCTVAEGPTVMTGATMTSRTSMALLPSLERSSKSRA